MAQQQQVMKPMSLEDDAFIQGGLLNDVDVEIVSAMWVPWDYGKPGLLDEDILALKCELQKLGEDRKPFTGSDGSPIPPMEQYWSAGGNFSDVVVSDDSYFVYPTDRKQNLTQDSNAHLFLKSLRGKGGMPVGYLEGGDLKKLKGIRFHLMRVPVKRDFTEQKGRTDKEGGNMVAQCAYVLNGPQPWGKVTGGAAASAPARTNGAPAPVTTMTAPAGAAADGEAEAVAERLIREVLTAAPGQTMAALSDLKVHVFRAATKDKTIDSGKRNTIGKLAENAAWIEERAIASISSSSGAVTLI